MWVNALAHYAAYHCTGVCDGYSRLEPNWFHLIIGRTWYFRDLEDMDLGFFCRPWGIHRLDSLLKLPAFRRDRFAPSIGVAKLLEHGTFRVWSGRRQGTNPAGWPDREHQSTRRGIEGIIIPRVSQNLTSACKLPLPEIGSARGTRAANLLYLKQATDQILGGAGVRSRVVGNSENWSSEDDEVVYDSIGQLARARCAGCAAAGDGCMPVFADP